ncbi:unnamed protein product [Callosobruchus maculatus]|uniref:Uncharacterized protein n=1 Tax=Callosobruchus maculatus TaxID=64391 RepID=A0A653D6E4_CALMS|nr:unnamed protein product [Callosobruchus maculatus]
MYKTVATLAVAIFAFIQISNAGVPGAIDLISQFSLGKPSHEISNGTCTNATMGTLVFEKYVYRIGLPFLTREAAVKWSGNETIYCVMATPVKGESSEGSTAEIVEGGVGHHNVSLVLKSAPGYGFTYNVYVFGNKTK